MERKVEIEHNCVLIFILKRVEGQNMRDKYRKGRRQEKEGVQEERKFRNIFKAEDI